MSFQILKPDTEHSPEMEDSGQLHVSATLPPGNQPHKLFIQGCGDQKNLPLQGYETRIVQAVG
jgi:hypothetical protein